MLLTIIFLPTLALSVLAAPIIDSSARIDEVHPELTAAVGDLGSVAQDNKAPDIWVVEKRAAQVDEVNPEQTAAVGDLGSAAPDDKAPNIWVVEKRAAQQSDSGQIWVVE